MIPCIDSVSRPNIFMKENQSRCSVISAYVYSILTSPLFWCLAITITVRFIAPWYATVSLIVVEAIALVFFYKHFPNALMHEVSLADSYIRHTLSRFFPSLNQTWWHQIEENLFLSAIPYHEFVHTLFHEKKIAAVLAILEEEEYRTTCFGTPIHYESWKTQNITFLKITCPDQRPLTLADLHIAADFIHQNLQKGVLVHCKAGRGRSAMAILAYQIKYRKIDNIQAHLGLKLIRKVVNLSKEQKETLVAFANSLS